MISPSIDIPSYSTSTSIPNCIVSFTLNTLRENGVYVFSTNKDDKSFIKYLSNKLELNHEEQIKLLTDMAINPHKEYIDKNNNPRKVAVKNELYPNNNLSNLAVLSHYSSEIVR